MEGYGSHFHAEELASVFLVGAADLGARREMCEQRVWAHLGLEGRNFLWPSRAVREAELLNFVKRFAAKGNAEAVLSAVEAFCEHRKLWLKVAGGDKAQVLEQVLETLQPKSVLEIGCYVGFSAIRLGAAVRRWHGRVISLEMDPVFAFIAREMVAHAGLEEVVDIRLGHSELCLDKLCAEAESFDVVFFDQRGSRFLEDLKQLEKRDALRSFAVVVADNVLKPGAPSFLWHVCSRHSKQSWRTVLVELRDFGTCAVPDWMSVSHRQVAKSEEEDSAPPDVIQHLAWQADEMRWRSPAAKI